MLTTYFFTIFNPYFAEIGETQWDSWWYFWCAIATHFSMLSRLTSRHEQRRNLNMSKGASLKCRCVDSICSFFATSVSVILYACLCMLYSHVSYLLQPCLWSAVGQLLRAEDLGSSWTSEKTRNSVGLGPRIHLSKQDISIRSESLETFSNGALCIQLNRQKTFKIKCMHFKLVKSDSAQQVQDMTDRPSYCTLSIHINR